MRFLCHTRENSLFHTVKYKNHSVGYIFHSVGYKSRTVKQRILKGKIKYAVGHPDFIAGAAGSIRQTRQKKILKADTSTNVSFQDLQLKARLASQTILLPAQSTG